jgi:hypothetical protein
MMTVIDNRTGREIELDDDEAIPPGHTLRVPVEFADSADRAAIEELRRRCAADDAGEDDANPYPVSDEQRGRVEDAYAARSHRLSAGMHKHRVPTPASDDGDVADDGDADRRAAAYDAMKKRVSRAWQNAKARPQPKPRDPDWLK